MHGNGSSRRTDERLETESNCRTALQENGRDLRPGVYTATCEIGRLVVADLVAILDGRPERQLRYATADQLRGLGRI